jgi:hypothetical protein
MLKCVLVIIHVIVVVVGICYEIISKCKINDELTFGLGRCTSSGLRTSNTSLGLIIQVSPKFVT